MPASNSSSSRSGSAVEAVPEHFDRYAERAHRAGLAWPKTRGPDRLADYLVGLAAA